MRRLRSNQFFSKLLERPSQRIRQAKVIPGRIDRWPAVEVFIDAQTPIQIPDELPAYARIRTQPKSSSLGKVGKDHQSACQIEDLEAKSRISKACQCFGVGGARVSSERRCVPLPAGHQATERHETGFVGSHKCSSECATEGCSKGQFLLAAAQEVPQEPTKRLWGKASPIGSRQGPALCVFPGRLATERGGGTSGQPVTLSAILSIGSKGRLGLVITAGKAEAVVNGAFELVPAALLHRLKCDDFTPWDLDDATGGRDSEVVLIFTCGRDLLDQPGVDRPIDQAHGEVVLAFQPLNLSPVNPHVVQCVTGLEVERSVIDSLDLSRDLIAIPENDAVIVPL